MREMLKHATIEDLQKLLATTLSAETGDGSQIVMLHAIVDELRDRGEIEWPTEVEIEQRYAGLMEKIKADGTFSEAESAATRPSWHNRLIDDSSEDHRKKTRKRKPRAYALASLAAIVLLINTITVAASGTNFLGDLFGWTGHAIYSLFGGKPTDEIEPIHVEMYALHDKMTEFSMEVGLPNALPKGFIFKSLEVMFDEEPYVLFAWFQNLGENRDFVLKIDGSKGIGISSKSETDSNTVNETVNFRGITYSLYENYGKVKVLWEDGDYELTLQGDLTIEEAKTVIESIQR